MAVNSVRFLKKIELSLGNSSEGALKLIEPQLRAYKGDAIQFLDTDQGKEAQFVIGTGTDTTKAVLFIGPQGNNKSFLRLEISSISSNAKDNAAEIIKKIDILIQDILLHTMSEVEVIGKAKLLNKGKTCPKCEVLNEIDAKFCKACAFNFSDSQKSILEVPKLPRKPAEMAPVVKSIQPEPIKTPELPIQRSDIDVIKELDRKYVLQYECELCDVKCRYKDPFLLLLRDIRNLKEPFKKFDAFLHTKDIEVFSNYIYNFSLDQLKNYPKFTRQESNHIAYCIFSILSFHILGKANRQIRLTFAAKIKERIQLRYEKEYPATTTLDTISNEIEDSLPTIKMGSLHIEENRCPYCYTKFDDRILKLKIKGYSVNCPVCDREL